MLMGELDAQRLISAELKSKGDEPGELRPEVTNFKTISYKDDRSFPGQEETKVVPTQKVENLKPTKKVKVANFCWTQVIRPSWFRCLRKELQHHWNFKRYTRELVGMRNFNSMGSNLMFGDVNGAIFEYETVQTGCCFNSSRRRDVRVSMELFHHICSSIPLSGSYSDEQLMNMIRARLSGSGSLDLSRYSTGILDGTGQMAYHWLRFKKSEDIVMGFRWPGPMCPVPLNSDTELARHNSQLS